MSAPPDRKLSALVTDAVYRIATGAWPANQRLPTVRAAAAAWKVSALTALRAYRRLAHMGLIRSAGRAGYFVAGDGAAESLGRRRVELQRLYGEFAERIRSVGDLSVLGALRYLAALAEERARAAPECAFVECTRFQAEQLATEVAQRLSTPCLPLTVGEIDGRAERLPPAVGVLLTTSFHRHELAPVVRRSRDRIVLLSVPIEAAPETLADLPASVRRVTVVSLSGDQARHIAADMRTLLKGRAIRIDSDATTVEQVEPYLSAALGRPAQRRPERALVLSTSLWSAAPAAWKQSAAVRPVDYRVVESAWPSVAAALGLPLGAVHLAVR